MSLSSMLESIGTLTRYTPTRGTSQSTGRTYATVSSNNRCSIQSANAQTRLIYNQKQMDVSHTIYFESNIGAQPEDIFTALDESEVTHKFIVRGFRKSLNLRINSPYMLDVYEIL